MLVLLSVLASAYASAQDPGASLPPPPDARFALALYCNPTCEDSVLDGLDTALATIEAADEFSDRVARPQRIMGIGGTDFGIPDSDFVAAYGVEVDRPDELAASQMVLLAWFASPRERSLDTFAAAHAAFAAAAASTGGWVEDLDTQTLFGARAFAARDPRDVPQAWFVIEDMRMVEPAEGQDPAPDAELRLVTRGLRRYGDYELVVENVAPESAADVGWVLDAVATTLHPLGEIAANVEVATASARGIARLEVALPRDDDPTEHFLRVRFDGELTVPVDEPVATGGELTVPDAAAAEGSPSEAAAASVEPGTPRTLDEARDL